MACSHCRFTVEYNMFEFSQVEYYLFTRPPFGRKEIGYAPYRRGVKQSLSSLIDVAVDVSDRQPSLCSSGSIFSNTKVLRFAHDASPDKGNPGTLASRRQTRQGRRMRQRRDDGTKASSFIHGVISWWNMVRVCIFMRQSIAKSDVDPLMAWMATGEHSSSRTWWAIDSVFSMSSSRIEGLRGHGPAPPYRWWRQWSPEVPDLRETSSWLVRSSRDGVGFEWKHSSSATTFQILTAEVPGFALSWKIRLDAGPIVIRVAS